MSVWIVRLVCVVGMPDCNNAAFMLQSGPLHLARSLSGQNVFFRCGSSITDFKKMKKPAVREGVGSCYLAMSSLYFEKEAFVCFVRFVLCIFPICDKSEGKNLDKEGITF